MSTILIGSSGNIGTYLLKNPNSLSFITMGRSQSDEIFCDLSENKNFNCPELPKADTAIFLAGITNINFCEENRELAYLVNFENTIKLVKTLNEKQTRVIFLSTSCVFSEQAERTDENALTDPANYYGELKYLAEMSILENPKNTIVRVPKIICPNNPLILSWLKSWKEGQPISAFSDVKLAPVHVSSLAIYLAKLSKIYTGGITHLSSDSDLSYYEFAKRLADNLDYSSDDFVYQESAQKRKVSIFSPLKASLDCCNLNSQSLSLNKEIKKIAGDFV